MAKTRVVIVDDEPITRMDLKEILEEQNYEVAGEAGDGFDAVEVCKKERPDLVLMDIKMPLLDGFSAAKIIFEEGFSDTIVLLTAYNEQEFVEEAKAVGVSGYLVKPVDEKSLIPSLELAMARSREIRQLKNNLREAEQKLEDRKLIEKAKGRIMHEQGLTEAQAHQYIRDVSQAKNVSMRRVAELVLMRSAK